MDHSILAFGASSSRNSINKKFVTYISGNIEADLNLIDLNDFEMPLFSVDKEKENGIPEEAHKFKTMIKESDGIIISFAEHNGAYSTAFKNLFDWTSRIEKDMWAHKPMFLASTSPGKRGGKNVLNIAVNDFPHRAAEVVASFSLPSFNQNFSVEEGILDAELKSSFLKEFDKFLSVLKTR